jgi:cytochrome c oxidase accessory protein FixG
LSDNQQSKKDAAIADLYAEAEHWHINTGDETIHAKRIPGKWRTYKWIANSFWLIFFLGPYLRWGERQAVLFDIPNRQFHIFGVTILPQDFWMLSLLLLFFAILLAVATALAGRVYCGFFCFQTVWTDIFTWIEDKLEGTPQKRRKLEKAPWDANKIKVKGIKHFLWILIGFLTGVAFVAWFVDVFDLWAAIFTLSLSGASLVFVAMFTVGTYVLAGFLREQACFWLCPYARIQAVMIDKTTAVPTYDFHRGEPKGRMSKGKKKEGNGDCVDCAQCVAVCPTGVDIRHGQQEGCIMCGLCIDACDAVMDKVGLPTGLIRYESLDQLNGKENRPMYARPRVWVYTAILFLSLMGIGYGLSTLDAIEIKVLHSRAPLFVMQSDGSIQNKYTIKVLNKMTEDLSTTITASGPKGLELSGADAPVEALRGQVSHRTVFVNVPKEHLEAENMPITFRAEAVNGQGETLVSERESVFIGPK